MANKTLNHGVVCIPLHKTLHHRGIFVDDHPLDHIFPVFMLQLIFSALISRAMYIILRPFNQSKFICNILAGIILGPSVLGRSKSFMDTIFAPKETLVIATVSNLAADLSVFLVCIKMDPSKLIKSGSKTWIFGLSNMIISFLFTAALTFTLGHLLPGIGTNKAFFIQFSVVSSLSFFIVVAQALDELNLLTSDLGQLSTSIAMLNDIVSCFIIMMGVVIGQKDSKHDLYAVLSLLAVIAFVMLIIWPILHWIIKRTPKGQPVKECYVTAILIVTLLLGMTSQAIGATFSAAAIVMGFIIPDGPPLGATLIQRCELLISEFFLPFFFVQIGYYTNLSAIHDWKEFFALGGIILVGYTGKLVACISVSSFFNMSKSSAFLLSLILSLQGLIELLYAIKWRQQEFIDDQNYATLVFSIVIMNAILTPMIAKLYKTEEENCDLLFSFKLQHKSLRMTSCIGELRIIACVQEEEDVPSIINLLKALDPNEVSPICAYVIHLVALATQTIPCLSPYKNDRRKTSKKHSDSDNIMRAFLNYAENSYGPVQIQPFRMCSPYKYMHQPICRLAEAIETPLIIVPFFKSKEVLSIDGTLRIFNNNIQAFAKCTVGILVDRGCCNRLCLTSFSYNVAVIFIGGADDREALAFATRISSHPNVAITVWRVHFKQDQTLQLEIEEELDESVFKEFKAMNISNACVVCNELVAHDSEEVTMALRSLGNTYDLVVVGKRQGIPKFEDGFICWTQYPELGVIGDAIAAPDFLGGVTSILVLQHHGERGSLTLDVSTRYSYFSC